MKSLEIIVWCSARKGIGNLAEKKTLVPSKITEVKEQVNRGHSRIR